ncbi:hypothetical protein M885DRAFT_579930 [Pelagophyceae sp. CCMP2097]|nr:hypothetical protein M885DRAFT_579930 [Pelagophyceae sp. CCMP2097]
MESDANAEEMSDESDGSTGPAAADGVEAAAPCDDDASALAQQLLSLETAVVYVVSFSFGKACGALDAAEAAMMIKTMLAPTHSKAAFSLVMLRRADGADDDIEGRLYIGSAAAAARAAQLDGCAIRAEPRGACATARASAATLAEVAAELSAVALASVATTLSRVEIKAASAPTSEHARCYTMAAGADDAANMVVYAVDDVRACAVAVWRLVRDAARRARPPPRADGAEAARAALHAHNAAHAKPTWDARTPAKFDAKLERWRARRPSLGSAACRAMNPQSPPTVPERPADQYERCAWMVRKPIKRSTWLALHRRRVAEKSLRVEDVVEQLVDADGSRWTLTVDARRRDASAAPRADGDAPPYAPPEADSESAAEDCASDLGVYAKCDFGGPGAVRPFGACAETRFAFGVVEDLADDGDQGGLALQGCAGSRAASWLFRGRELYDDQSVPTLPARGFARLVVGSDSAPDAAGIDARRWWPPPARGRGAASAADDEEPTLVICAAVLVFRRLKGVDTWRLVRRCCAERASGYSLGTLAPRSLFSFLCRAVRWGDVECAKAIARQIQHESGGETAQLLRLCSGEDESDSDSTDKALACAHPRGGAAAAARGAGGGRAAHEFSVLHWLGNCDDGSALCQDAARGAGSYAQIVAWLRSVCGADAFDDEVNGHARAPKSALTPLAFACSCGAAARPTSRRAVLALLRHGADPTRPVAAEPPHEAERGTFALARALYSENCDIAIDVLAALFPTRGGGAAAWADADEARERAVRAVVADAVDVLLSKADEAAVATGLETMLGASAAAREATLAALRRRHADAVGRDADRSPVHELVACMETNPSTKQRERPDLAAAIDRTLALASRLVREERLALRHARGGERVRLYLEAFVRRQAKAEAQANREPQGRGAHRRAGAAPAAAAEDEDDEDSFDLDDFDRDFDDDKSVQGGKPKASRKKKRAKAAKRKPKASAAAGGEAPGPAASAARDGDDDDGDDASESTPPSAPSVAAEDAASDPSEAMTKPRAVARLRELVASDDALEGADLDELELCRRLTRGLEGSKRDRETAKKMLRRLSSPPTAAAPSLWARGGAAAAKNSDDDSDAADVDSDGGEDERSFTTAGGRRPAAAGFVFVDSRDEALRRRSVRISARRLGEVRRAICARKTALFIYDAKTRCVAGPLAAAAQRFARTEAHGVVVVLEAAGCAGAADAALPKRLYDAHAAAFRAGGELGTAATRELVVLLGAAAPRVVTPPTSTSSSVPGSPQARREDGAPRAPRAATVVTPPALPPTRRADRAPRAARRASPTAATMDYAGRDDKAAAGAPVLASPAAARARPDDADAAAKSDEAAASRPTKPGPPLLVPLVLACVSGVPARAVGAADAPLRRRSAQSTAAWAEIRHLRPAPQAPTAPSSSSFRPMPFASKMPQAPAQAALVSVYWSWPQIWQ